MDSCGPELRLPQIDEWFIFFCKDTHKKDLFSKWEGCILSEFN